MRAGLVSTPRALNQSLGNEAEGSGAGPPAAPQRNKDSVQSPPKASQQKELTQLFCLSPRVRSGGLKHKIPLKFIKVVSVQKQQKFCSGSVLTGWTFNVQCDHSLRFVLLRLYLSFYLSALQIIPKTSRTTGKIIILTLISEFRFEF